MKDAHLIYARTPAGEKEIRRCHRLPQQELGRALVLVDGRSSVAQLSRRAGGLRLDRLLAKLEQMGFVRPLTPPLARNARQVEAGHGRLSAKARRLRQRLGGFIDWIAILLAAATSRLRVGARATRQALHSGSLILLTRARLWRYRIRVRRRGAVEAARPGRRFGAARALLTAAILLGAAVLALPFVPLNPYIPFVQRTISEGLGEPASIGSLRMAFLPRPHLALRGVVLGTKQDIRIGTVRIVPELFYLFRGVIVPREVELESASFDGEALGRTLLWPERRGRPRLELRRIRVMGGSINLGESYRGQLDADIRLDAAGAVERIAADDLTHTLHLEFVPAGDGYRLEAEGRDWRAPTGTALVFDEFHAEGTLTKQGLRLDRIAGKLYRGSVSGRADLAWGRGARLDCGLTAQGIDLKLLMPLLSKDVTLEGRLGARIACAADAVDMSGLPKALRVDAAFLVEGGALYNVDLAEVVRSLGKAEVSGGLTRFDHLSGRLTIRREGYYYRQLELESGHLAASGSLDIIPQGRLSGRIKVELRGGAAPRSAPMRVSGSLSGPMLHPLD